MPRPRRKRRIDFQTGTTYFKPQGIPLRELEEVVLTFEEIEAMRLIDIERIGQTGAAKKMNVSQPTFYRILNDARKKTSDAIVNGKAIRIEGGDFEIKNNKIY